MCASHRLQRRRERVARRTHRRQQRATVSALHFGQREQEMLRADVVVAKRFGICVSAIEHLIQFARDLRLRIALFRIPAGLRLGTLLQLGGLDARLLQQRHNNSVLLRNQRQQQMKIIDKRIAGATRRRNRVVDRFAGLDGKTIWIQHRANRGSEECHETAHAYPLQRATRGPGDPAARITVR